MKLIKLIPAVALTLGLAFASYAENKTEAKAEPSKTEAKVTAHTYYVVGQSGPNYLLSDSPNPNCGDAEQSPCEISSTNEITTGQAPKTQVDNETNGFTIMERQPQLP